MLSILHFTKQAIKGTLIQDEWVQVTLLHHLKKPTLTFSNAGFPDTKYLYYPLHAESVTLKGSLLLVIKRQNK